MQFEFATASRIVFGAGTADQAVATARNLGRKALLVTGRNRERAAFLAKNLDHAWFSVTGEPSLEAAQAGARVAHAAGCDVVVGIGGGAALDAAKAIAALATNGGDLMDYLEVIGAGKPLEADSLPFVAIPTTAGTGAEVTRNAVLSSAQHRVKVSLRSPRMLAKAVIIDPELHIGLPPHLTASTGLDALTQVIEPYIGIRANALTDLFCLEGMRRVARSLEAAYLSGGSIEARTDMAYTALMGGLALANAGLGVVHGFAAPIGGRFPTASHGAICAALLPHGMSVNLEAMQRRRISLERFQTVAAVLTGSARAEPEDGVRWVADLCARLGVKALSEFGVTPADVSELTRMAGKSSSMRGNPVVLDSTELAEVVQRAL